MPVEDLGAAQVTPITRTTPQEALPEFLTIQEAADFLGVSTWCVRENIHEGNIPHLRISSKVLLIPKKFFSVQAQQVTP